MPTDSTYRASPRYDLLGPAFFDLVPPAAFPRHTLRYRNDRAAAAAGLSGLSEEEWEEAFARFRPLPDNLPGPLAIRYHGHQFRMYNPRLGDGRGFLFAQLREVGTGRLLDLGTKGSGTTPWSRGGDGRLTLKGGLREILATELLEALGVPTSRSLSLYETHEQLWRHDEPSPTRGSVLVRLSHSHVRIGVFQRLAWHGDLPSLRRLLDYCAEHLLPELQGGADLPRAFLRAVARRTAELAASWMVAGFVHGVLNTDNINITGESFDYGPWRFLPEVDPAFTAAYFDESGLYAYGRQPESVLWALLRLRECVQPLGQVDDEDELAATYDFAFREALRRRMVARLGLRSLGAAVDERLQRAVFRFLEGRSVPYGRFCLDWWAGPRVLERNLSGPRAAHYQHPDFAPLRELLGAYSSPHSPDDWLVEEPPLGPPLMLYREVEQLWSPIADRDDWGLFHNALQRIGRLRGILGLSPASAAPGALR
jgi:uncharacterized protein YdiU (UPF0061 family)